MARVGWASSSTETFCNAAYTQHQQQTEGYQNQARGLGDCLSDCHGGDVAKCPYPSLGSADYSAQLHGVNGVPRFHPHEQNGQNEGDARKTFMRESALAHIGPEVQKKRDKGKRPDKVSRYSRAPRTAQQVERVVDNLQRGRRAAFSGAPLTPLVILCGICQGHQSTMVDSVQSAPS